MSYKSRSNYAYRPNPAHCCERCVFGTGEHIPECVAEQVRRVIPEGVTPEEFASQFNSVVTESVMRQLAAGKRWKRSWE